jgi:DNA-binding NtrC family response regulator
MDFFLHQLNRGAEAPKRWRRTALQRLRQNPWIGNVRELKNVVQRAYIMGDDEIGPEAVPLAPGVPVFTGERSSIEVKLGTTIEDAECALILATLRMHGDDKRKAAETLGVSLKTLYNRLNVYGARGLPTTRGVEPD